MSSQGEQERLFREPPSDLFTMPTNRVTALMNDGEGTAAAVAELIEGGLPEEQIFVLCGVTGLERLDLAGRHHSRGIASTYSVEAMGGHPSGCVRLSVNT
jgi:hypothetical protein